MIDWRSEFINPRFAVAMTAVGVFAWAFGYDPADATMKGAIIGGFNLALGFYLGSTSNSQKSTENVGKAFDAITATATGSPAPSTEPQPVTVVNDPDQPVPTSDVETSGEPAKP